MLDFALFVAKWAAILFAAFLTLVLFRGYFGWAIAQVRAWVRKLIELANASMIRITSLLVGTVAAAIAVIIELMTTALICATIPPEAWLVKLTKATRLRMRLLRLYMRVGRESYENFGAFKKAMGEDEELKAFGTKSTGPKSDANLSAYERALEVMGLTGDSIITMPKVKQRYRQLMSLVHPDKGFPNQVFAQQINDAMETIKRERGWT